ncbi:MAG: hypothetical protein Kow0062_21510 [Acidobacteriota bacterium]
MRKGGLCDMEARSREKVKLWRESCFLPSFLPERRRACRRMAGTAFGSRNLPGAGPSFGAGAHDARSHGVPNASRSPVSPAVTDRGDQVPDSRRVLVDSLCAGPLAWRSAARVARV